MKITKNVKAVTPVKSASKGQVVPAKDRVKTSIMMPPHKLAGPGFMIVRSKGSTRWERLKNIILFAWRYVMNGSAIL